MSDKEQLDVLSAIHLATPGRDGGWAAGGLAGNSPTIAC